MKRGRLERPRELLPRNASAHHDNRVSDLHFAMDPGGHHNPRQLLSSQAGNSKVEQIETVCSHQVGCEPA